MRKPSLLRSGAFRFAILIAALFVTGSIALLLRVEHSVSRYATEAAGDNVSAELAALRDEDRAEGRAQLVEAISSREHVSREHQLRYLLVDNHGLRLVGSIPISQAGLGWHDFVLPAAGRGGEDGNRPVSLTALGARLEDGAILVVGTDTSDLKHLRRALGFSTMEFGIGISLLALLGGLLVGTVFLRRLDRVNRAVERIMHGSLTERLPAIGMSAEFDELSTNLNLMLDRIEGLMTGLRQVSTDIAHDLRTPLTRLRQRLEDMKAAAQGRDAVLEDHVDAAIAQTDSILAIFHALLRISSLEVGAGRHRFAEVDLSGILERVYQAYLPVAEDTHHILFADIQPDVRVPGDAELLAQAITNLIENALVHTPPDCRVHLSLSRVADRIVVAVSDNGPGIPEEGRGKVLRRFYRLDRSRNSPGAGLGLALVSAIASLHDAQLELLDNHPGLRVDMTFSNEMDGHNLVRNEPRAIDQF